MVLVSSVWVQVRAGLGHQWPVPGEEVRESRILTLMLTMTIKMMIFIMILLTLLLMLLVP